MILLQKHESSGLSMISLIMPLGDGVYLNLWDPGVLRSSYCILKT